MSYDITFCISRECPMLRSCQRSHYVSEDVQRGVSMANFYVADVVCTMYWPVEYMREDL